ncbi:MAG: NUDIX hydrolase [Patescibacteria group bacterium]
MKEKVICHDKDNKEYAVAPDQLVFRPSAYGLLIEDGKVLLSRQWDGYDFPGGGVEIDETLEEAVVREFWEETGLKVRPLNAFYATSSFFKPSLRGDGKLYWNCQLIYFLVEKIGGEISIAHCDEFEKKFMALPEWLDIDSLAGLAFYNPLGEKNLELARRAQAIKANLATAP